MLKLFVDICVGMLLCTATVEITCDYTTGNNCTQEQMTEFRQAYSDYMKGLVNGTYSPKDLQYADVQTSDYFWQSSHVSDWVALKDDLYYISVPEVWTYESRLSK
jgi:hypothetical protein